jgi:hypothetical protein
VPQKPHCEQHRPETHDIPPTLAPHADPADACTGDTAGSGDGVGEEFFDGLRDGMLDADGRLDGDTRTPGTVLAAAEGNTVACADAP